MEDLERALWHYHRSWIINKFSFVFARQGKLTAFWFCVGLLFDVFLLGRGAQMRTDSSAARRN